jgi:mono/diheme cytochrome c family protein
MTLNRPRDGGLSEAGTEVARRRGRRCRALALVIVWIATSAGPGADAIGAGRVQDTATRPARTVWDGVYTEEQATRGQAQYLRACASCHAADLRGGSTAPSLVEESFSFQWADTSVGELFERIRMLMPSDRPNSLSSQTYRDVVAFILQANKFPYGEKELDTEVEALRQILITARKP